ncbi:MAG TPA: enoyl-CoA hydratase-related protein [Actinomycetota bacterium]|nr:enoyl-CoA hydratase-related protein [Actinomycetota bacterium]
MTEVVRLDVRGRVATVTLNRPDRLNAMTPEVFAALGRAGERIGADREVRAVLIEGEGRAFSSGLDLTSFGSFNGASAPQVAAAVAVAQSGFRVWSRIPQPVVAAVHGYALGAGFQLALAADLVVASTDAVFGMLEINYGLVPDLGGTHRLPARIGPARAKELIWTGRRIDASIAEAWGIVNRLVEPAELAGAARELVADLASRPPVPVAHAKRLVDAAARADVQTAMDGEAAAQVECLMSKDMLEAVGAAFEKRAGEYHGE